MFRSLWFTALVICCAGTTSAVEIAYEGFDYPAGVLMGDNGGAGFAGPWVADANVTVQLPGLSSPKKTRPSR